MNRFSAPACAALAVAALIAAPAAVSVAWAQTQPPAPAPTPAPAARPAAPKPAAAAPAAPAPQTNATAQQRIDAARQLYQQGKLLQAADELGAAIDAITSQLGQRYGQTLPPAPQGWVIDQPDPQRLALMGGGMAAIREYKPVVPPATALPNAPQAGQPNAAGQPSAIPRMNARIVLDGDAVRAMAPLFGPAMPQGTPPTVRKIKIGQDDAVVAYDPNLRAGEVSLLVGGRILLQVEGQGVQSADPMIQTMQRWNTAELKKLAGM